MKSIMEEASSVSKAIEKGWLKAGKPREFSVKIFEEPQKNFFGLTVTSAKIGIFFNDIKSQEYSAKFKQQNQVKQTQKQQPIAAKPEIILHPKPQIKSQAKSQINIEKEKQEYKSNQPIWTEQMLGVISQWLKHILKNIKADKATFSISPQQFHLKIKFDNSIFENKNKEKQLFSSLSTLILQMLKKQYNRPLKGYKIIFISAY